MQKRSMPIARLIGLVALFGAVATSTATRPVLVFAAATVATCAPDSGSAKIGGTVTGEGGAPLSGVNVTAYTSYGKRGGYATTNASGVYQISGLIGGSYIVEFEPSGNGYTAEWSGNTADPLAAATVAVAEGGTLAGINAQLDLGARFGGVVTGAGAGPLQSVLVRVYNASGQSVASAYTNTAGAYVTSPGLPSGSYRIGFEGTGGFLDSYYAGKASLETADPVPVVSPNLRNSIDAVLEPGGQIRGTVTSAATGLPLGSVYVSAYSEETSDGTYTNASGIYTLDGLPSGRYEVQASPASETINLVRATQVVSVTAPSAAAGVDFTLMPGGTLSGRVTNQGGTALKDITVYLSNEDGSYQNYVSTNVSGEYTAVALPSGQYRVLFRPSSYVPEAYNNQPDFQQAERVTVVAPMATTGIDAVLAAGGAIKGTVSDATTGLPIKNIFVEILDLTGDRVETANTQADGTYETSTTLPSGDYLVRFNADERFASCTYVTEYYNDKTSIETADRVTISAPSVAANIDATLARGSMLFGKLTDATTGAPITSGQVNLYDEAGKAVMFGRLTFLGGWYSTTGLPSGSYRALFRDYDSGYVDEYYNDKATLANADPLLVSAPADITGLDVALAPGAVISGRVTAADTGQPFTAGNVEVYNALGATVGYAYIEDDGSYKVSSGLASGSYRVGVIPYSAEGEQEGLVTRAVRPAAGDPAAGYSATFYGGSVALGAARPLALTAPTASSNVDIAMLRSVSLPLTQR